MKASTVTLSGLEDDTDYFFTITGTDQAGNTVVDDNGGGATPS